MPKNEEYERCIAALERSDVPFKRTAIRIEPFDTREQAEAALQVCRQVAPEAPIGIQEVTESGEDSGS